ncbi:hypothetical protein J2797_005529 [Paraburkholderia terricola]|nr:hypothetical protein [Paraburkholderia terricola]
MQDGARNELRRIGELLDSGVYPVVRNGGVVVPREPIVSPQILGQESKHVRPGKEAAKARPRARESERQGASSPGASWSPPGPGTPRPATPLVVAELRNKLAHELAALEQAYPGTRHWLDDEGMWFVVESSLLPRFSQKAVFIVAIRFADGLVRGWGFWGTEAVGYEWIGPRHTNFPDGSICAFEPTDDTWTVWSPLVGLLDLYTLWAVRQLHLRTFGRWPGYQSVRYPYERTLELREDEYCGCARYTQLYGKCCRDADRALSQIREAVLFTLGMHGGLRQPPSAIVNFLRNSSFPPDTREIFPLVKPSA